MTSLRMYANSARTFRYRREPRLLLPPDRAPLLRLDPLELDLTPLLRLDPLELDLTPLLRLDPLELDLTPLLRLDPLELDLTPLLRLDPLELDLTPLLLLPDEERLTERPLVPDERLGARCTVRPELLDTRPLEVEPLEPEL